MEKMLLRVPEAAQLTGLSKSYLYKLILSGELLHVKFGRAVRIPVTVLQAWVAAHATEGRTDGCSSWKEEENM